MKLEIEKLREKMNYYKNDPFKELPFFSSPGLKYMKMRKQKKELNWLLSNNSIQMYVSFTRYTNEI